MSNRALRIFLLALLVCATPVFAVDGIAISAHFESERGAKIDDDTIAPAALVRHDIRDDKVATSRVLFAKGARAACISPCGDRIALAQTDGTLSLIGIDGGALSDLIHLTGDSALQWPASDGGEWIYYLARKDGTNAALHRVNVRSKVDEVVVRFNRAVTGSFAIASNATPAYGQCLVQAENNVIIYDLARGDGELFNALHIPGSGANVSPDASLFTVTDGEHTKIALVDMTGQKQSDFPVAGASSDFRWSTNSLDWIATTQGKSKPGGSREMLSADVVLYDWAHQRQVKVTANRGGSFDRAVGFWKSGERQGFLGYFRGEAPFIVEISDPRLHDDARWDLGDDAHAAGRACRHTYDAEGAYTVSVKDRDQTYEAQVTVIKRQAPVGVARCVNPTCVVVEFDEPVQATKPVAVFESGVGVAAWTLNESSRRLTLRLSAPLRGRDQLHLSGVTDRAQIPNSLEDRAIEVVPSAWPSDRSGLAFIWEDAGLFNAIWDAPMESVRSFVVARDDGRAGLDRSGRMRLDGGRMRTGFCIDAPVKTGAFSLEATIQPASFAGRARIISFDVAHDDAAFMLAQQEDRLVVAFRTAGHNAPLHTIAKLPDTRPHHVCVAYRVGRLVAYMDGKEVFKSADVNASIESWSNEELYFGDRVAEGHQGWRGRLEGVAIYTRFIEADEAQKNQRLYAEKLASRKSLPQIEVEAKVLALSPIPTRRQMTPYREALAVNEFEVTKIITASKDWAAPIAAGQRIRVAQWAVIDDAKTDLQKLKVGDTQKLVLEAYEKHPDKIDEVMTSNTLPIDGGDPEPPLLYEPGL